MQEWEKMSLTVDTKALRMLMWLDWHYTIPVFHYLPPFPFNVEMLLDSAKAGNPINNNK